MNPGRTYSTGLVTRNIRRAKNEHFGTDPDSLSKFMDLGYGIRNGGGVFKFVTDDNLQIVTVFLQVGVVYQYHSRIYR